MHRDVVGDPIRINAWLVSTANGQTVSAAGIGIGRNGGIAGLLQQPIGNAGGICCGVNIGSPDSGGNAGHSGAAAEPVASAGTKTASYQGVTFAMQNVSRSTDKKVLPVVLAVTNKLKTSDARQACFDCRKPVLAPVSNMDSFKPSPPRWSRSRLPTLPIPTTKTSP